MAILRNYRNNINIHNQKIGLEKRQEILDNISAGGTFLPKSVLEEDMDQSFVNFISSDNRMVMSVDGEKIPVIFLTIQRWTEFTKTWEFTDEFKNIKMPFITIVRRPDIQQGQNQAGLWNIPGNNSYTYMKVPTWDGVRNGVDLYKIQQPTSVDITYEVRLFTTRMKDLNRFNRKIQKAFQSRQCYINVNGHPMPLHLENIGDESNIEDFENRRFYVQSFEIKLLGYIMDSDDFEVIPTINRVINTIELDDKTYYKNVKFDPIKNGHEIVYTFVWEPKSESQFSFTAQYDSKFTQLRNIEGISRVTISVNDNVVFDGIILNQPLFFYANDIINIKVYKSYLATSKFILIGNTTS